MNSVENDRLATLVRPTLITAMD